MSTPTFVRDVTQPPAIWFMEGMSSQRGILIAAAAARKDAGADFTIIGSHRANRPEIMSEADLSFHEPQCPQERLDFIVHIVGKHNVVAIQAGRGCRWFEEHRAEIEALGVQLTTGAGSVKHHHIADHKDAFAQLMETHQLPVVPSIRIETVAALKKALDDGKDSPVPLCVKPVVGIYGAGFWILDPNVRGMRAFDKVDERYVHPSLYLQAQLMDVDNDENEPLRSPLVLMPYLPGPERSVDMLVENGEVIAAIARIKEGQFQRMENEGPAIDLAKQCAAVMKADGIVNVQTRNDHTGKPVLLEINMRPSGGMCRTIACGVNLPALFTLRKMGLITMEEAKSRATQLFKPAKVRAMTHVVTIEGDRVPSALFELEE